MEHYFFSDLTADDACTQGLLVGIAAMKERILRNQMGDGLVDKKMSQGGSESGPKTGIGESVNEIIIVYNGEEYQNSDEILIEEGVEEIILEVRSNQELTEVVWKGAEGAEGDGTQATLNMADQSEKEFVEVKVTSGD